MSFRIFTFAVSALLLLSACNPQTLPKKLAVDNTPKDRIDFIIGKQQNFTLSYIDQRKVVHAGQNIPLAKNSSDDAPIIGFSPALNKTKLSDFSPRFSHYLDNSGFKRMSLIVLVKQAQQSYKSSLLSKEADVSVDLEVLMRNGDHKSQAQGSCKKTRSSMNMKLAAINALYQEVFGCAIDRAIARMPAN